MTLEGRQGVLRLAVDGDSLTPSPAEAVGLIADVAGGGHSGPWRLETSRYTCGWPEGFTVLSTAAWPGFELLGPNGEYVFAQGPLPGERLQRLDQAVAPGQRTVNEGVFEGIPWIDVEYEQDGIVWQQRLLRVPHGETAFILVTGQGTQLTGAAAARAASQFASTIGKSG